MFALLRAILMQVRCAFYFFGSTAAYARLRRVAVYFPLLLSGPRDFPFVEVTYARIIVAY